MWYRIIWCWVSREWISLSNYWNLSSPLSPCVTKIKLWLISLQAITNSFQIFGQFCQFSVGHTAWVWKARTMKSSRPRGQSQKNPPDFLWCIIHSLQCNEQNYCFMSLFQNQKCWLESPESECMRWGWQTKQTREQMSGSRTTPDQIKSPHKTDKTDTHTHNKAKQTRCTSYQLTRDTTTMSHTSSIILEMLSHLKKHLRLHWTFPTRALDGLPSSLRIKSSHRSHQATPIEPGGIWLGGTTSENTAGWRIKKYWVPIADIWVG